VSRLRSARTSREPRRRARIVDGSAREGEQSFVCHHCGYTVMPTAPGTRHRNHCPHCLWSRHVDRVPGDRRSSCCGAMAPVAVWLRAGEWALLHRCERCAVIRSNRIAGDDHIQTLLALASAPLSCPPTPACDDQGTDRREVRSPEEIDR
jgi:DNA-directed RNA polymerase subunit RPC12/RpoP